MRVLIPLLIILVPQAAWAVLDNNLVKSKKSPAIKTAEMKQSPKKQTPKTKTSMVSYPQWLEIPKSPGSSMSVYGGF